MTIFFQRLVPSSSGGTTITGGDAGQVLSKLSSTDGDFTWVDLPVLPTPGTDGQVLTIVAGTPQYEDPAPSVTYRQMLSISRRNV
jgi:hypothetical protein